MASSFASPTRLTRSAMKLINSNDVNETAPDANHANDAATGQLLQEYETFHHGLGPAKRRRVADATTESENIAPEEPAVPSTSAVTNAVIRSPLAVVNRGTEAPVAQDDVVLPELQLAAAEKALDGAPEGELYVVTVLASDEIGPAENVEAEVAVVVDLLKTKQAAGDETDAEDVSWAKEYAALDSLRRLALHHPGQLKPLLESSLSKLVWPAANNLRSAMARNALLCLQDIVEAVDRECEPYFGDIVPLLVHRMANEKQFIRDLARDVLAKCVDKCASESLLKELLKVSEVEKNAQIVSSAGVFAEKCADTMSASDVKAFVTAHDQFCEQMSAFLNCKVVECKAATRRLLQHVRKTVGDSTFTAMVKSKLDGSAQFDLLKASEVKKPAPAGKSGLPKLTMRERMLQMKKQQQAESRDSEGNDKAVVEVVAPPPSR